MPSRLTNERCVAIAQEYCSNGYNKTNALRSIKNKDGKQYYSEGYCNNGLGHKLFENIRVKTEIDRIQALRQAENKHNYEIAVQKLLVRLGYIQPLAEGGNIDAVRVQLAIIRELDDITGLHKTEIRHKALTKAPDLTEAEERTYDEAATRLKIRLAGG